MAQTLQHTKVDVFDILKELPPIIDAVGNQQWFDGDGKLHRDNDRPAFIWWHGGEDWYQHGKLHRDDGMPAIIYASGKVAWYEHGVSIK